ncbi:MAG: hypothetical protein OSJ70_05360 [Bacilli bacterium]|nr:hypothetical protein [Bacilli bacterium]
MEYTVSELKNGILSKLYELGISPKFKENPAFSSALSEINGLINNIPLDNIDDEPKVKQFDKAITFTYTDDSDIAYALGLTSYDSNSIKCFLLTEKSSIPKDGEPMHQRSVIEKTISLEGKNNLSITTLGSTIDNYQCPIDKCNNSVWQETEKYSSCGLMLKKEIVHYTRGELNENFKTASIDSMLYIPRKALIASDENIESLRSRRTVISREYLDTAHLFIDDFANNLTFSSSVPLNQESGLRNMNIDEVYMNFPKEVFIPPVEDWELDLMICGESNPKVQEGLKDLSHGRVNYSYDSTMDKKFERIGFNDDEIPKPAK